MVSDICWQPWNWRVWRNSQNNRTWLYKNPRLVREKPLQSQKIGMWCAVSHRRIVGTTFFETTVNSPVYQDIIRQFIALLEVDERECWLQQYGATSHTSNETMPSCASFSVTVSFRKDCGPRVRPICHPRIFPFGGYLKGIVYKNNPHTLDDLKRNITTAINSISLYVYVHTWGWSTTTEICRILI
jgi:hypothetical protein